jgi:GNAT superfamily N-acetyltransferase
MIENHRPNEVRLYFKEVERVAENSLRILQRTLSDKDFVNLIAARAGDMVVVSAHSELATCGLTIPIILIQDRRAIRVNGREGLVVVKHILAKTEKGLRLSFQNFSVPDFAQGKGLGTLMLAEQVEAARAFGFEKIVDYADNCEGRNGYYTWPRLGFDKELTEKDISRLPDRFKHFRHLSDFMVNQQACEWWKKHGFALELTFDTLPDSRSMELLKAAIERLHQRDGHWARGPETPLCIERLESWNPRSVMELCTWEYLQD